MRPGSMSTIPEPPSRRRDVPSWGQAAEDWLAAKQIGRRADDPGNSDRARRDDLRRMADAIHHVMGRDVPDRLDLATSWDFVMTEIGSGEVLEQALAYMSAERKLAPSTVARTASTTRGFCQFLVRRGLLSHDPTDSDTFVVRQLTGDDEIRACTEAEISDLLAAAWLPAEGRIRSMWPARDVAVIETLSGCGLRVSELCALHDADISTRGPAPVFHVTRAVKGGRRRQVPIRATTFEALHRWQHERDELLPHRPTGHLFVRRDGSAMSRPFVDTLLRRVAVRASVELPEGAATHALRHSYGVRLALAGVRLSVIQQLMGHVDPRTTAVYTRAHGADLTAALAEAGLLS